MQGVANRIRVGAEVTGVNTHLTPIRTVVALGAAISLTVAACGGDDDSSDATTVPGESATTDVPTEASDGPPDAPASITADDQESDGTSIVVASIELPAPGFIAVHADGGGSPGAVIGNSDLLPAGTSTDVAITLGEPLTADATVYPMAHIDMDEDGIYEFAPPDETTDGPALTADGDVAVVPAAITLGRGAGDGEGSGEAATSSAITIADFSFSGVTEVPVGTTVTVTNNDSTRHTWTATDDTFDSGTIEPGASFEFTFTEPGEFEYFCNFHPSMEGAIVVTG